MNKKSETDNERERSLSNEAATEEHGVASQQNDALEVRRKQLADALTEHAKDARICDPGKHRKRGFGEAGAALRLSSEFIGGVAAGALIGYLIDIAAGTNPWGLIVFLLLGFCAGVLNVLRTAGLVVDPVRRPKQTRGERAGQASHDDRNRFEKR